MEEVKAGRCLRPSALLEIIDVPRLMVGLLIQMTGGDVRANTGSQRLLLLDLEQIY
jgi:hypothetical protein